MNPIEYNDYKEFLRKAIKSNSNIRGYQGKLAHAAHCQKSYFSKVVNGDANFTIDQAMGLAVFFRLDDDQTEYFLELVNLERSSTKPLIVHIKEKLRKIRERRDKKIKKTGASEVIANNEWRYYSQWHWSAIHILTGISRFQKAEAIAKCLKLDEGVVIETLSELKKQGLVESVEGRWIIKPTHRHLDSDSPLNSMNHANWRNQAVLDSHRASSDSLHYTAIQSHNAEDFDNIKQNLLKAILTTRNTVKISDPDEDMSCVCIDFFKLT